jgi:hypothetical protein
MPKVSLPATAYYQWHEPDIRAALDRLVGIRVEETQRRFRDWLVRKGFWKLDDHGNLRASPIPEGEGAKHAKARAVLSSATSLLNLVEMYGKERLAGKRWHAALTTLEGAIAAFLPLARARVSENGYFARKGATDHYEIERHTESVRALAESLAAMIPDAKAKIRQYKDDPLPTFEAKRPHRRFLATLEADLSIAGFGPAEIADLIIDDERGRAGDATKAKVAHRARIEKRIQRTKPKLIDKRRHDESTIAQWRTWCASHGKAGGNARAYLEHLEQKKGRTKPST